MVSAREESRVFESEAADRRRWPEVDHAALLEASPGGVFVLRLARDAVEGHRGSWAARAAAMRDQADVGDVARIQVRARLDDQGVLPFVATVAGYPVLMGQLVDFLAVRPGRVRLELTEPDPSAPWLTLLEHRRLITSPGPGWLLLGSQPYHQVGWGRDDMWARAV